MNSPRVVHEIRWNEVCPWLLLVRTLRIALSVPMLFAGTAGGSLSRSRSGRASKNIGGIERGDRLERLSVGLPVPVTSRPAAKPDDNSLEAVDAPEEATDAPEEAVTPSEEADEALAEVELSPEEEMLEFPEEPAGVLPEEEVVEEPVSKPPLGLIAGVSARGCRQGGNLRRAAGGGLGLVHTAVSARVSSRGGAVAGSFCFAA